MVNIDLKEKNFTELRKAMVEGLLNDSKNDEAFEKFVNFIRNFHNYSIQNRFLIYFQYPAASQAAGEKKWNALGRFKKDGERKLWILAPKMGKKKIQKPDGTFEDVPVCYGFKYVPVLAYEQTDGKALEKPVYKTLEVDNPDALLAQIVEKITAKGWTVAERGMDFNEGGSVSYYGKIIDLNSHNSAGEKLLTILHEMAHVCAGHGDKRSNIPVAQKEAEAELAAYLYAMSIGLPKGSVNYIHSWTTEIPDAAIDKAFSAAEKMERIISGKGDFTYAHGESAE